MRQGEVGVRRSGKEIFQYINTISFDMINDIQNSCNEKKYLVRNPYWKLMWGAYFSKWTYNFIVVYECKYQELNKLKFSRTTFLNYTLKK